MGIPYTSDLGMSCHLTRIDLFYFDDNFRRIAQWVPPFTLGVWPKVLCHTLEVLCYDIWDQVNW